jgi:hypothetical protein
MKSQKNVQIIIIIARLFPEFAASGSGAALKTISGRNKIDC